MESAAKMHDALNQIDIHANFQLIDPHNHLTFSHPKNGCGFSDKRNRRHSLCQYCSSKCTFVVLGYAIN